MATTWIEAALNGPWGRERQPGIPVCEDEIVADGIACAEAGAAILHVHAYDPATGRQRDDWQIYARIIERLRTRTDAIVYPTLPLTGSEYAASVSPRFAHVDELGRRGLIEWTVVDPGAVAFVRFDEVAGDAPGFTYENRLAELRVGMAMAARHGLHPSYAIYEPGFTRQGAALARAFGGRAPIYRFMFSDDFAWGFPPRPEFLDAHLRLLRQEAGEAAPWMVAGLGVDISALIAPAVTAGGHVRVGLEDAPWGTTLGNRAWTEAAVRQVHAAGSRPATPGEVRAALNQSV